MVAFIFLDQFLVLLTLQVVAFVAERLEVGNVVEPILADRPRYDVVHAGCRLDYPVGLAHLAERVCRAEGAGEPRPPVGVVRIGGAHPVGCDAFPLTLAPG